MSYRRRIAIVGGGPIGIEAAARARAEGFDVTVYEEGRVGEHLRQWQHVTLFSPWELNRSPWGKICLPDENEYAVDEDAYPTGLEYLERYLLPLAKNVEKDVEFCLQTRVLGVSRKHALKGEYIGNPERSRHPFLLRVDGPQGQRFDEADVVIDASGVLDQPNPLGPGGLPALGERQLNGEVLRRIPDVFEQDRSSFANKRVLVVGHGHSALTTLDSMHKLRQSAPQTEVCWAFRCGPEPCAEFEDDPLPHRARLERFGNAASRDEVDGIQPFPHATVYSLEKGTQELKVILDTANGPQSITVDRVVANVGYRPDTSLYRELQIHLCYASGGPMKLAANLLADSAGGDCLQQKSGGAEVLENPEPNFFILGAKSYGRNSNFLLRLGFEQIDDIFTQVLHS